MDGKQRQLLMPLARLVLLSFVFPTSLIVHPLRLQHVGDLIGADAKDIVFTSGATESNNMIIKGVARFHKERRRHIITTQTEHKCVLDSCRKLSEEGFDITYLPVQSNGVVDLGQLETAIRPDQTILVSIMTVNNETGVIQPIHDIGRLVRKYKGVYFHTDAAQAAGKIPLDVNEMNIDLMSVTAHKIYGPKGIGAAYVRRRPRVRLDPIISGGGQERGLRSGTLPAPLAVGLGEACRIAAREMAVSVSFSHLFSLCVSHFFDDYNFARGRDASVHGVERRSQLVLRPIRGYRLEMSAWP